IRLKCITFANSIPVSVINTAHIKENKKMNQFISARSITSRTTLVMKSHRFSAKVLSTPSVGKAENNIDSDQTIKIGTLAAYAVVNSSVIKENAFTTSSPT